MGKIYEYETEIGTFDVLFADKGKRMWGKSYCVLLNINDKHIWLGNNTFTGKVFSDEGILMALAMGYDLSTPEGIKMAIKEKKQVLEKYEQLYEKCDGNWDLMVAELKGEDPEEYAKKLEREKEKEAAEEEKSVDGAIDDNNNKISTDKFVKKGLTITNGMIVEVKKEGQLYRAYDDSGKNYSSVISNKTRKKSWVKKKSLKAKISIVNNPGGFKQNKIIWSLDESSNYREELMKKYGEKFGLAVFNRKVIKGMNLLMVEDVVGKHSYNFGDDYYFGKPFNRKIVIKKDEVIENKPCKEKIWLDMPKDILIASWGNPGDKKETVTKSSIKQRLFFNGRDNRQGGISFEYQVDVENDLVVGWKELE